MIEAVFIILIAYYTFKLGLKVWYEENKLSGLFIFLLGCLIVLIPISRAIFKY